MNMRGIIYEQKTNFMYWIMEVSMLWNISDVLMGVMALINIPVILILSNTALKALEDYEKQKKNGENPVFKTGNIGLEYETDYWS